MDLFSSVLFFVTSDFFYFIEIHNENLTRTFALTSVMEVFYDSHINYTH